MVYTKLIDNLILLPLLIEVIMNIQNAEDFRNYRSLKGFDLNKVDDITWRNLDRISSIEKQYIFNDYIEFIDQIAPLGIEARTAQAGIFFSPKPRVTLGGIILSGGTANIEFNMRNGVAKYFGCDFQQFEAKYQNQPNGTTFMRDNWVKSVVSTVGRENTLSLQSDWLNTL